MHTRLTIVLVLVLMNTMNVSAAGLTGSLRLTVQPTEKSSFRYGIFDNTVDETVGAGDSPSMSVLDLQEALEEFANPQLALARLEEMKGPKKRGEVFVEIGYLSGENRSRSAGDIMIRCGAVDSEGSGEFYLESGSGIVSRSGDVSERSDSLRALGKFYQFKRAHPDERIRLVAHCLARLPGMPPLKARAPSEPLRFFIDDASYQDAYQWISSIPGVGAYHANHPRFRNAVKCLLREATERVPGRSGNTVILQSIKGRTRRGPNVSVNDGIGEIIQGVGESLFSPTYDRYHSTGLAITTRQTANRIVRERDADRLETDGVWPSVGANGVQGVLRSLLGDELEVQMKACFLSTGLAIPNPNASLPTIYDPARCREVAVRSLDPLRVIEIHCEGGNQNACLSLGSMYLQGTRPVCHQGRCFNGSMQADRQKALSYFEKVCHAGLAAGCYAYGRVARDHQGPSLSNRFLRAIRKACHLQHVPECDVETTGAILVTPENKSFLEAECQGPFNPGEACHSLGVNLIKKGQKAEGMRYLKKACDYSLGFEFRYPCVELGRLAEEAQDKEKAREYYAKGCNFHATEGCPNLGRLAEEEGKVEEAIEIYKKTCSLPGRMRMKEDPMPQCHRIGELLEQQGKVQEARTYFRISCNDPWDIHKDESCAKLD